MLQQSGEASITYGDGVELKVPVFQCDNCVTKMEFLGGEAEVALTFAVDDQGKLFDPEDPDRPLHF